MFCFFFYRSLTFSKMIKWFYNVEGGDNLDLDVGMELGFTPSRPHSLFHPTVCSILRIISMLYKGTRKGDQ